MGERQKRGRWALRSLTLGVSLGCYFASAGCMGPAGLKVAGDPLLGERRGPTPSGEIQPTPFAARPGANTSNPIPRTITSTPDPLFTAINSQPGTVPPPRTGVVPQLPRTLSANNNVEMTRNLQTPGQQPLGIAESNPWMLTSQNRDGAFNNAQSQTLPPVTVPVANIPGLPKVVPVPLDASSTSKSIGLPAQSPWSPPSSAISTESLKGALDSRGVFHKTVAVPEGIKLIAVVPSRDMTGTSQVLEVVTSNYQSAVQAILPRIDQLQGKR